MEIFKIPKMKKEEYDRLIADNYICRIAFVGQEYPYIAPFLYVFDGRYIYFLSTKYGYKIKYFQENPKVNVEIESYQPDLSEYAFVSLMGQLKEVKEENEKKKVRQAFFNLIQSKNFSKNIMFALGYSAGQPLESIINQENNLVWQLVNVKKIIALKN